MKIISLVSSYRRNGNTSRIVELIENHLLSIAKTKKIDLEIERVQIGRCNINICRGCRVCFDKGEELCPLKDDLLSIRDKICKADGILAASPVYVEDVNGIMKNWIDRMAFNCHRPAFAGKVAYIVTTSGAGASNHTINTIKNAFTTWGISIAGQKKFRTGGLMDFIEMQDKYGSDCKNVAITLLEAVKNNSVPQPSLYSLIAFKIQQLSWQNTSRSHDTFDYKYWQKNGWLEEDCNYYLPNNTNMLKIKFARMIGRLLAILLI
jgi:multimeric flavodoxin WrbA